MLLIVYATTIFLTASLLFVVQPMFAKMVLPLLGGSPAVWNTCLVFYQAALLAGYLYAHATTSWLGVPVLAESRLRLAEQSRLWSGGYLLLLVFTLACAMLLWRSPVPALADPPRERSTGLAARRRLRWVLLALVPSSLMLSVTTFISADVEAIPLLWVIPLAIYLLTFVLVFARRAIVPHALMVRALPIALLALVVVLAKRANQPLLLIMGLHLAVFFVAAMVCHGELAKDRPPPTHLTEFYLWLSVGGVLGGVLNALVAPLVFDTVAEYPLTLVLLGLLAPGARGGGRAQAVADVGLPGVLGAVTAGLLVGTRRAAAPIIR